MFEFGEKKRLREENEELRRELGRIASDPMYGLVKDIHRAAEGIVSSDSTPMAEVSSKTLQIAFNQSLDGFSKLDTLLISEEVRQRLEQLRDSFDPDATERINEFVDREVEYVLTGDSHEAIERIEQTLNPEVEDPNEARELLKQRAKELRHRTKKSHTLPLEILEEGDEPTLAFTKKGGAYEKTHQKNGWRRSYNSDL